MLFMDELIRQTFTGRSTLLLGFGREGEATLAAIRKVLPEMPLHIADAREDIALHPVITDDRHVHLITGKDYMNCLAEFDLIVRSPGIVIWPFVEGSGYIRAQGTVPREKITSQTDLFLRQYSKQVVGVTGTKGKSTTSSLIFHILKTAGRDALLAGNIGNPVFHIAGLLQPDTTVVVELSSHQLEFLTKAPHQSVFLNLYQEHLDAYPSFEAYQEAKTNITRMQTTDDFLICNADDPLVMQRTEPYRGQRNTIPISLSGSLSDGVFIRDGWVMFRNGSTEVAVWKIHQDRFLRGEHNLRNIMAAIGICMIRGLEPEAIQDGIGSFKGLAHRLEYVGEFGGIHFYNDSIATIPEACMAALQSLPDVDTLVAGGFDRGIDYEPLGLFLANSTLRTVILAGDAGQRIGEAMQRVTGHGKRVVHIRRFDDFLPIAFRETRRGHTCLLSPAAASYDDFRNFEERGNRFRQLVMNPPSDG